MMSNPFATLGLSARYALDQQTLHQQYIQASAATHPDRFADPLEQADAARRAAQINEAYRVLKDPEARANALLALWGGPAKEDDSSLPPDLLMEVMEMREAMEDATASKDHDQRQQLTQQARDQHQQRLATIAQLFEQAHAKPPDQRDDLLSRIRLELNALRYFQRMIEQTATD